MFRLNYLDHARGLFKLGSQEVDLGNEDSRILTGYLVLSIGLEKLIKYALTRRTVLLTFQKIEADDVIASLVGIEQEQHTVSLEVAFSRLAKIVSPCTPWSKELQKINEDRNMIAHREGQLPMPKIEKRARVKVTDIAEWVCRAALGDHPDVILGNEVWGRMSAYRDAYDNALVLAVNQRIAFLRHLYEQGEPLPCPKQSVSDEYGKAELACPICNGLGDAEIQLSEVVDIGEGYVEAVYPYISVFACPHCGFTVEADDLSEVFGDDVHRLAYPEPDDWDG